MRTSAFAPATVANLAAGFVLLGAAVQPVDGAPWGDVFEIADAAETELQVIGPWADEVPKGRDNLCWRVAELVRERLGGLPPLPGGLCHFKCAKLYGDRRPDVVTIAAGHGHGDR